MSAEDKMDANHGRDVVSVSIQPPCTTILRVGSSAISLMLRNRSDFAGIHLLSICIALGKAHGLAWQWIMGRVSPKHIRQFKRDNHPCTQPRVFSAFFFGPELRASRLYLVHNRFPRGMV